VRVYAEVFQGLLHGCDICWNDLARSPRLRLRRGSSLHGQAVAPRKTDAAMSSFASVCTRD
jgi:hypothetical protein